MAKSIYILFLLLLSCYTVGAQVQPFSRKDSAQLAIDLQKYKEADQNSAHRSASMHLNNIAFLYWNHNNYQEAIKYYEKSVEINKKLSNENGLAMLANNLGLLYADTGNYERSLEFFESTLATRRANKEQVGMISALINMSVVQNNLNRHNDAIASLEEALALAREINDVELMRSTYGMLSETYQAAGNQEKSIYYFKYYRSFHELSQKKKIENISEALEEEQNKKKVLEEEHKTLSTQLGSKLKQIDQLSSEINMADATLSKLNKDIKSKDLKLKVVEQEKELLALKAKQEEEKVAEANRRRWYTIIISAILIGSLLLIFGLVWRNRKQVSEKNRQLTAQNAQIVAINDELTETNAVKDRLFSIIGHDLRAPFAQLEQTFEMLNQDLLDEEETEFIFKRLRQNLKQSTLLLENLLIWAKNQMQGQAINISSFVVNEIVDESIFVLQSVYQAKHISINKDYQFNGQVASDKDMLMLIVRNLVSNAIKFTPKKGEIAVQTAQEGAYYVVKVIDHGVGMDEDQLSKLFKKTSLQSKYGTDNEKGMGIGLNLCYQYIQALKGNINVESTPNVGSTFTVMLPVSST